jgi:D-serine deaminase-like pyridoxal phosphate-dependent protein
MNIPQYTIDDLHEVPTPALVYYKDVILSNIKKTINLAGTAQRLWPHVKTHKMAEVVRMQQKAGIQRFKCATLAEAEMLALCKAQDILLAYPLVGPNIELFIRLIKKFPCSRFWATGDTDSQVVLLAGAARKAKLIIPFLVDVDIGMNRTGVPLESADKFFVRWSSLKGLDLCGLHCFNGNYKISDPVLRCQAVEATASVIFSMQKKLRSMGQNCSVVIVGSTPSMPAYAPYKEAFVSPGTSFITDYNYYALFPDLNFLPAAALLTRVISKTGNFFTLDLGYKAIAADPKDIRGVILGLEDAKPVFHCEEHWVFEIAPEKQKMMPQVGTVLTVIPAHICPTTALYPSVLASENGRLIGEWEVNARNRKITV